MMGWWTNMWAGGKELSADEFSLAFSLVFPQLSRVELAALAWCGSSALRARAKHEFEHTRGFAWSDLKGLCAICKQKPQGSSGGYRRYGILREACHECAETYRWSYKSNAARRHGFESLAGKIECVQGLEFKYTSNPHYRSDTATLVRNGQAAVLGAQHKVIKEKHRKIDDRIRALNAPSLVEEREALQLDSNMEALDVLRNERAAAEKAATERKRQQQTKETTAKKKKKKTPANGIKKPKKAMNAYLAFVKQNRSTVAQENPDLKNTEVMAALGTKWKELSKEDKIPYEEMAAEDKKRFEEEKKVYDAEAKKGAASAPQDAAAYHDADEIFEFWYGRRRRF